METGILQNGDLECLNVSEKALQSAIEYEVTGYK